MIRKLRMFVLVLICFAMNMADVAIAEESDKEIPDLRTRKTGFDWPTFLGPNGDSKSAETNVIRPWPENGPPIAWQKKVGEGDGAASIAKGRLFLLDRVGDQMRLSCMNSESGEDIWRFEYTAAYEDLYKFSNGPRTTPVIENERVYIFGVEGMIHCLNVLDGELIWKVNTTETFNVIKNFFGAGSTPVIEGDLLIAAVGGSPPTEHENVLAADGKVSGNGSGIVAFNKYTGEVVYQSSDMLAAYASPKVATINRKRQGFYFARSGLMSFEPTTGEVYFHFPWRAKKLESVNAANPVFIDDSVFISETYGPGSALLKMDGKDYAVVWQDQKKQRERKMELHWNTAVHHDGYLYACHGRNVGVAAYRCIEVASGKKMWDYKVKELSSLLYVDGHFIGIGERGTLTLFKATPEKADVLASVTLLGEDGKNLLEYPAWSAPVISNGYLYLRGKDRLVCLDLLKEM